MNADTNTIVTLSTAAIVGVVLLVRGLIARPRRKLVAVVGALDLAIVAWGVTLVLAGDRSAGGLVGTALLGTGLILGVAAAVAALVNGFRGRYVGTSPHCRACGYDLTGRAEGTYVCPECGTDLTRRGAIVVGERQRAPRAVAVGVGKLVLAIAGAILFGRGVIAAFDGHDWRHYWPDAWLVRDVRASTATTMPTITAPTGAPVSGNLLSAGELRRRFRDGALGDDALLAIANDAAAGRIGPLTNLVPPDEALARVRERWASGALADEAGVRALVRQSLDLGLDLAPFAAPGHVLRYAVTTHKPVVAGLGIDLAVEQRADALDGRPLTRSVRSRLDPAETAATFGDGFSLAAPLAERLHPGPTLFESQMTVTATLAAEGRPTIVERREVTLRGQTQIVDESQMRCVPITVVTPGTGRGRVRLANVDAAAGRPPHVALARRAGGRGGTLRFTYDGAGAYLSDVLVAADGADALVRLGTIFLDPTHRTATLPLDDVPTVRYELRLEPVPERGPELMHPQPIYAVPLAIPSTAIEVAGR